MARRRCPQCAEKVRQEALICRHCGSELPELAADAAKRTNNLLALGVGGVVALIGGSLGYYAFHDLSAGKMQSKRASNRASTNAVAQQLRAQYPQLAVGQTLEWTAEKDQAPVLRQAGPYALEITRRDENEMAAPVLKLTAAGQTVTVEGELASAGFTNKVSLIQNRAAAVPVVMLQSFSGGAHCCNHVQLAGFSNGKLKVVDLGSWDGDDVPLPHDVTGDGIADFVMQDNRFLYAFSSYAQSYAPPQIFNVVGGKMIDVSTSGKFNSLYLDEMKRAGADCQPGNSGANGACPAFVAAAARLGKLDQAWAQMVGAYDARVDWNLPTGCWVSDKGGCPDGQEITYKSYPEALHAFLVRSGYIARVWRPPEERGSARPEAPQASNDDTA